LRDASLDKEVRIKFWKSSISGIQIWTRSTLPEVCALPSALVVTVKADIDNRRWGLSEWTCTM